MEVSSYGDRERVLFVQKAEMLLCVDVAATT
jgi:hypothetical protein